MSKTVATNSTSLIDRLKTVPKCDLSLASLLQSSDTAGELKGDCAGHSFMITYQKGSFLLLSMLNAGDDDTWKKVLNTLRTTCNEFMEGDPICQYTTDERKLLTVEWELNNPDQVLNDIVNNGGHHAKSPVSDLVLFGERKISDYENAETKKKNADLEAERVKNARIYGLDTGGYDKDTLDKMTEWELFLEYYGITKAAWNINHALSHSWGSSSEEDRKEQRKALAEMQYGIQYLLYYISKRLGIPVAEPEVDKDIKPDRDFFMKWYGFYDHHFMHELSDKEWEMFENTRKKHGDISRFLPVGDWHNYQQ